MKTIINKFEHILQQGLDYLSQISEEQMSHKPSLDKWSKIEILGHLIDSGINNLQRFTEIQFEEKPYQIRKYNQDGLIKANDYQKSDLKEIANLWGALNYRILIVMKNQTESSLSYQIILPSNELADLKYLMTDYVNHLEHHLKQIFQTN